MAEPYFNTAADGQGLEGLMNYGNKLVDGGMVTGFLFFIFVASTYVLSKSEWKLPASFAFSSLVCLLLAMIFKLFTVVNEIIIFILIVSLAGSILWAILSER